MAKIGINISTGSLQKDDFIVGIDLGTTNSLVAIIHPDSKKPVVLKEFDGSSIVPSIIHFGKNGEVHVGDAAKPYLLAEPQHTIFSVKRLMGKSYSDVTHIADFFSYKIIDDGSDSLVKVQAGNVFYNPIELSGFILRELKNRAEHILKTTVSKAVITVPAYFNDAQRQATRDAGKLAGLDVLRIINEPTAASLAYGIGIDPAEEKTIAVYDLGGGTFDISILRIHEGVFEVLSTNGDTFLGGDDFDNAIVDHWLEVLQMDRNIAKQDQNTLQELRLLAEEAKRHLSIHESFHQLWHGREVTLSRELFENLILPYVQRTLDSCNQALKDASIAPAQIDEVVMVGGSTRVPFVQQKVQAFFERTLHNELNPDEVVALGAAVQADILAGNNKDILLLDVTPLSLGIETMGGLMDVLIPRNSKIPSKAGRQYTTFKDGQTSMSITVYQGERDLVKDNRLIGSFILKGIPAMPAGLAKVEIAFLINADGILVVTAKELRSGVQQQIEIKPQYGLTDEQVEQMLMDSIVHAKDDIQARALAEAKSEAAVLIHTTEAFLVKNAAYLQQAEIEQTHGLLKKLQQSVANGTKDAIQKDIETLNTFSKPYAERVMDVAIGAALKGKQI